MPKQVVVIAGPTGSGESTITNEIINRYPRRFSRLVTATTRPPRASEKNLVDYHFFSEDEFRACQERGEMLEATYIPNRSIHYGTYAPDLNEKFDQGFIVIANLDLVGAEFYKKNYGATTIFIMPENIDELMGRIQKRNPEMNQQELLSRRENAEHEMAERSRYDYIVVNSDGKLERAIDEVVSILKKEGYIT